MSTRTPRAFGDVKHSGITQDDTPPPRRARPGRQAGGAPAPKPSTATVRWSADTLERAHTAQAIDRRDNPDTAPRAFNTWVNAAINEWARLGPTRRAHERDRLLPLPDAGGAKTNPIKFRLTGPVSAALDDALDADVRHGTNRGEGRSRFVTLAVLHAIATSQSRNGGDLTI